MIEAAGGGRFALACRPPPTMSRKNQPAWTPPAEHPALLPPFSGNQFNGWGEAGLRRPRQIFWLRKPEGHPYARLLEAVKQRFVSVPAYRDVYALADRGPGKLPPPAENRRVAGADSWTRTPGRPPKLAQRFARRAVEKRVAKDTE
jgi:hypothetical protein